METGQALMRVVGLMLSYHIPDDLDSTTRCDGFFSTAMPWGKPSVFLHLFLSVSSYTKECHQISLWFAEEQ